MHSIHDSTPSTLGAEYKGQAGAHGGLQHGRRLCCHVARGPVVPAGGLVRLRCTQGLLQRCCGCARVGRGRSGLSPRPGAMRGCLEAVPCRLRRGSLCQGCRFTGSYAAVAEYLGSSAAGGVKSVAVGGTGAGVRWPVGGAVEKVRCSSWRDLGRVC